MLTIEEVVFHAAKVYNFAISTLQNRIYFIANNKINQKIHPSPIFILAFGHELHTRAPNLELTRALLFTVFQYDTN